MATIKDGVVSVVLRVSNEHATEAFALHEYMDKEVRVEFWIEE